MVGHWAATTSLGVVGVAAAVELSFLWPGHLRVSGHYRLLGYPHDRLKRGIKLVGGVILAWTTRTHRAT